MSDQDMEMQFADPDWQPTSTRQSSNARQQPPYVPLDVHDAPRQQSDRPKDTYDRDKANTYGDYNQGYQANLSSHQYQESAQMPRQQARHRRGPWFWILTTIIVIILFANPIGEDSILLFWRVLLIIAAGGLFFALFRIINKSRQSASSIETHTFSVGAQPKIIIKDDVGAISRPSRRRRIPGRGSGHQTATYLNGRRDRYPLRPECR